MKTITDKSKQLAVELELQNEKLHFTGHTDFAEPLQIDYVPPFGDNLGYTSLELLLFSLASCVGSTMLLLTRRMGRTIHGLSIQATGDRRQEHPTAFSKIAITLLFNSPDLTLDDCEKARQISESSLCPVYSMVKGNVEVETVFEITNGVAQH
jgi:putative redox protein